MYKKYIALIFSILLFIAPAFAANETIITNTAAIAMCDALVDLVDGGSGAGKLRIYDGTKPAYADTAVSTQTLLVELTYSDPAFGACADGTGKATGTADTITSDSSANASGTATWFRVVDSDNNAIWDGTVGTSGADLNLNSVAISAGATVSISAHTISVPESQ